MMDTQLERLRMSKPILSPMQEFAVLLQRAKCFADDTFLHDGPAKTAYILLQVSIDRLCEDAAHLLGDTPYNLLREQADK